MGQPVESVEIATAIAANFPITVVFAESIGQVLLAMPENYNVSLLIGALLSGIAAMLHLAIIVGGPAWYRYFGAGERFAVAAAEGRWWPALITFAIAGVLSLWAAYALSGAGAIRALPLLRLALVLITAIYLLRGLALVPALWIASSKVTPFLFWSSLICIGYGLVHLLGLVQVWTRLSPSQGN